MTYQIKKKIEGAIYTVFTPFLRNLNIDYKSLEKYLDFLSNNGAQVFYVMPYNSRYSQLTEKEILELNKFCILKIKSLNKTIIVSDPIHGPTSLKEEYCHAAKELGADIFASICREKYFCNEQIFNHYNKMSKYKIPLLVHVMPFLSGYTADNMEWPISIFKQLKKIKNIIAIKEDTKSIIYANKLIRMFEPRFKIILAGRKNYFLKLNKFSTYLNGISIIDPKIDKIFLYLKKKNIIEANKFVREVDNFFWDGIVKKYGWHRTNKALLEAKGFMSRRERLPMIALNKKEFKDIKLSFSTIEKRLNKFI